MEPLICAMDSWVVTGLTLGSLGAGGLLGWFAGDGRRRRAMARLSRQLEDRLGFAERDLVRGRQRERDLAEAMNVMAAQARREADALRADYERQRDLVAGLNDSLSETTQALECSRTALQDGAITLGALRQSIQLREDAIRAMAHRLETAEAAGIEATRLAEELASRERGQRAIIEERTGEVAFLRTRLAEAQEVESGIRRQWAAAQEALRRAGSQHEERAAAELAARHRLQARLAELEPRNLRIHELEAQLAASERRRHSATRDLELEIRRLRDRVTEADAAAPARPAEATPGRPDDRRDDLQRISGIGPVIARLLDRMGITTYRQIARWSEADIERVARALGRLASRIRRDRWIERARQEHLRCYGEDPLSGAAGIALD